MPNKPDKTVEALEVENDLLNAARRELIGRIEARDRWIDHLASDCDHLASELTQLRAEVEQYKFLLEQAKTLRRDNMILRQAIETHRRNVWGEVDADHDQDIELYKALDSIDYSASKVR